MPEAEFRGTRLVRAVAGRFQRPFLAPLIGTIAGAFVGGILGAIGDSPLLAATVTFVWGLGGAVLGLGLLIDRRYRAAFISFWDHYLREREQWKADTGTELPRTIGGMRTWLDRNPDSKGRVSILLGLGRLQEADEVIAGLTAETDAERFDHELLRVQSALYAGRPIDLAAAEQLRREIQDPRARVDRAQCLAITRAVQAADRGADPVAILVDESAAVSDPGWASRPRRWLARIVIVPLVLTPVLVYSLITIAESL